MDEIRQSSLAIGPEDLRWRYTVSGEVGAEEVEGALAGLSGGGGVVVGAMIAVEAVARVFVDVDGNIGMGLLDLLDFGGADVFIVCTKMQHDGTVWRFAGEFSDLPAVVGHDGGWM